MVKKLADNAHISYYNSPAIKYMIFADKNSKILILKLGKFHY